MLFQLIMMVFLLTSFSMGEIATNQISKIKDQANQLFDEFWEWRLINNPQLATKIGISKYDDRITEMSLSSYMRRADSVRTFLKKLSYIMKDTNLTGYSDLALDVDLLRGDLEQYLSGFRFKPFLSPINNMEGPHNDHINLISMMKKSSENDMNNIIRRIRLFSQQIDEMIALMREGIRLELTMNRRSFERLGNVYENIASAAIKDNPFFESFKQKPVAITTQTWNDIVDDAKKSIRDYVQPSFRRLQKFIMEEYLPKSRPEIGLSSLPNGRKYYQECLKYHTTTNLTPTEIHAIGLREVERITDRMEEVKTRVKYKGTLSQFRSYLRTEKSFGFISEREILTYYKNIERKVRKLLPKYIHRLPTIPLRIAPVPPHLAPAAAFAYYEEPSPDGKRPGTFYINTYKPEKRRKYVAISLFLHEALPGHHIQIASKLQFGPSISFRRYAGLDAVNFEVPACFASNNAYIEGWGLYSEYLGEEMGLYENPYDLFGRLSQEMLRAARLVVDTGMHALGWSRTRAINFMRNNTAGNIHDIMSESDRYISWPGQACSYKIGEIKIKELRRMAEQRLGKKFDVRDFHEFIISIGNIPLTILEKQFKLYLNKKLDN